MYRIYDIKFNDVTTHLDEVFSIFDMKQIYKKRKTTRIGCESIKNNQYSDDDFKDEAKDRIEAS